MKLAILVATLSLVVAGCGSSNAGDSGPTDSGAGDIGTHPAGTPEPDNPGEEPEATPTSHTATEEEILDNTAPFYAREFNVSVEEAKRRLIRQNVLGVLRDEIRVAEGGRVVDMRMVHEPEFGQWIYLAGDDPPPATTLEILRANEDLHVVLGAE